MTELSIIRVGPHALTLLSDIRDNSQRNVDFEVLTFLHDDFAELHEHASESSTHYFIGFADNLPFGYLRISCDDGEAEIKGPFCYPEYCRDRLIRSLLIHALTFLEQLRVRLIYSLVPAQISKVAEAYADAQFEDLSDNIEFQKRWHDGILAGRNIPEGTSLFARLIELNETPVDSD